MVINLIYFLFYGYTLNTFLFYGYTLNTFLFYGYTASDLCQRTIQTVKEEKKEWNVLFNDAFNTFLF